MLAYVFVLVAILVRFLPFLLGYTPTWHFTPMGAALLYFGARQGRGKLWIPVSMFVAGDVCLNLFVYHSPLSMDLAFSAAGYVLIALMGSAFLEKISVVRVLGSAIAASLAFFAVSNLGVWAFSGMYPHTVSGLVNCFVLAIPFVRGQFAADILYSAAIFGAPALFALLQKSMRPAQQPAV